MLAALTLLQTSSGQPTVREVIEAMPDRDGVRAWEYTGAEESYGDIWFAASDHWLHQYRMGGRSYFVRYAARPAFGQGGFRQVVFRDHRSGWDSESGRWSIDYTYAQRLRYENADVMEAFGRAFPLASITWELSRYTRVTGDWARRRSEFFPDVETVVRAVRVRREIIDERSCPALTRALERLNQLEVAAIYIPGYGTDRRPPVEVDPSNVVVTGDGTGFELEIDGQGFRNEQPYDIILTGNHGSIPGEWIEQFEAETADCWRPDDGADPPG